MNRIGRLATTSCLCFHLFAMPILAEQDYSKGEAFLTGVEAYQMGDFAKARLHLLPLAEQGDAQVQHIVGLMYQNGWGFAKDYNQAMYWYRKSAEQGYVLAQTAIDNMDINAPGVQQDMTEVSKRRFAPSQSKCEIYYYEFSEINGMTIVGRSVLLDEEEFRIQMSDYVITYSSRSSTNTLDAVLRFAGGNQYMFELRVWKSNIIVLQSTEKFIECK